MNRQTSTVLITLIIAVSALLIALMLVLSDFYKHKRERISESSSYEEMILLYGGDPRDINLRLGMRGRDGE